MIRWLVPGRRATLGALLLLAACNQSATSSTPLVVVTVYPLYEFTLAVRKLAVERGT